MIKIPAKGVSYGGTRKLSSVKYIVIHNTGNNNDRAVSNGNYFKNMNTRAAGAHIFIDQEGTVVLSISLRRIAYAVGGFFTQRNGAGKYYKKCTNTNSVSIELCDIVKQLPSEAMIKSLKSTIKWIQSECPNAKTIIRHWDVNGKSCPAIMTGTNDKEWMNLLNEISPSKSVKKVTAQKTGATITKPNLSGKMQVTAKSGLNMRKTAGGAKIGAIPYHAWVKVLKKGKVWTKVTYAGKTGYVATKYLK